MTRTKRFPHKCEKALRYKNSNTTRTLIGLKQTSGAHEGGARKRPRGKNRDLWIIDLDMIWNLNVILKAVWSHEKNILEQSSDITMQS